MSQVYAPFIGGLLTVGTVIDITALEAFLIRQLGDTGDVFAVDTTNPGGGHHLVPPNVFELRPNGGNFFEGGTNQINLFDLQTGLEDGTQSGRLRSFNSVMGFFGAFIATGTLAAGGTEPRSHNASMSWQSSGTAAELTGLYNSILCAGAAGSTTGNITDAYGSRVNIGFQTSFPPDNGSYTNVYGYKVESPEATSATRTITNFYGIHIDDVKATGITNAYAVKTNGGLIDHGGRIQGAQGTDVASANDISIGEDGNYFDITGNTQINTMAATNVKAGTTVTLQFDSNPTVKHATAGAGAQFLLAGSVDFVSSANDTLTVIYDGTYWREISRAVI